MTGAASARRRALWYAALGALCVALLGGLATDLSEWYRALAKPAWDPPDWLFGPAWTLIYALTALAGVEAWQAAAPAQRRVVAVLFSVNGVLNVLWSLLFFRLRRPDWALLEVALLWLSILSLILYCGALRRRTIALLAPYLIWVSFAAALNAAIVDLNGPFDGSGD